MEPDCRLGLVCQLPRIPRAVGLRFPCNKSPVICANAMLFQDRLYFLKSAFKRPRHILSAEHRAVIFFQTFDPCFHACRVFITMERNDIWMCEHIIIERRELRQIADIKLPWRHGYGLNRAYRSHPTDCFFNSAIDKSVLCLAYYHLYSWKDSCCPAHWKDPRSTPFHHF